MKHISLILCVTLLSASAHALTSTYVVANSGVASTITAANTATAALTLQRKAVIAKIKAGTYKPSHLSRHPGQP
jgi:hypothetical protein